MKIRIAAVIVVLIALIAAFFLLGRNTEVSTPVSSEMGSPSAATSTSYTLAEVAQHPDASSCWVAINGKVYDLTQWIGQHPGGPERIISICGTDGSIAFNRQHGGESQPADELVNFYIGTLQ